EVDAAGARVIEPGEHVEERRLAGTVRPDDRHDRFGGDVDRDVADRDESPEFLRDLIRAHDRRGLGGGRGSRGGSLGRAHVGSLSIAWSRSISCVSSSFRLRSGKRPWGRSTMTSTRRNPKIPNERSVRLKFSPNVPGRLLKTSGMK